MGEIEVNEYVRTDLGIIYEYTEDEKNDLQMRDFRLCNDGNIVKHSKQLIDLIEVGDVLEIRTGLHSSFKYFVENEDNLLLLKEQVKEFWNIETILTHEQFEQNSYKVGEKDE